MDNQEAQHSSTTVQQRPQQPATAHAAVLPTEAILHVLDLSLEGLSDWDAQKVTINFGKVCVSWHAAALPLRHYVVPSSLHAEKLAAHLKALGDDGRDLVRSLHLVAEGQNNPGRGPKLAKLLKCCPQLERLVFDVQTALCTAGDFVTMGSMGVPVRDALMRLGRLRYAELWMIFLPHMILDQLLGRWPIIETLALSDRSNASLLCSSPADSLPKPFRHPPRHLRRLAYSESSIGRLSRFVEAASGTLKEVELGSVYRLAGAEVVGALQAVWPQLESFKIKDGKGPYRGRNPPPPPVDHEHYLDVALKHLSSIRTLSIGLDSVDPTQLFPALIKLTTLRHFTLTLTAPLEEGQIDLVSAQSLVKWLDSASPSLRTVTLPSKVLWIWKAEDREAARQAASDSRVELAYRDYLA